MRRVLVPDAVVARAPAVVPRRGVTLRGEAMGTTWRVDALLPAWVAPQALRSAVEDELAAIVCEMSTWRTDSDLARYGAAPAGTWVKVPQRLWEVVVAGQSIAQATGGAFDLTVAPLVDLWGFGPVHGAAHDGAPPAAAALAAARSRTGWQRIRTDARTRSLWQPGGIALDCSGIGKGYAVDRVSAILTLHDVADHLVDIGGELRGEGHKSDGMPWWVGIERPPRSVSARHLEAADNEETVVALHGLAIATSGDYRRRAVIAGVECAHTIDPRIGVPVRNGVTSVTVLHPSCMLADAWATALLVVGAEEGMRLAEAHGLAALIVTRDGERLVDVASTRLLALAAG